MRRNVYNPITAEKARFTPILGEGGKCLENC